MIFCANGVDYLANRAWGGLGALAGARFSLAAALARLFGGRLLAIALCLGLLAPAAPLAAQPFKVINPMPELAETRRALAEMMEAATVFVVVDGGGDEISSGTGFVVGEGRVMTNGHVVHTADPADIYILNANLPPTKARLLAIDYDPYYNLDYQGLAGRDFALLAFDPPAGSKLPILSFNLDARRMDLVGAWGYPDIAIQYDPSYMSLFSGRLEALESPSVVFTEGTVNNVFVSGPSDVIMHSAKVSAGNSGGPLVNINGEVVGINTLNVIGYDDKAVLNFAMSARDVVDFLANNGVEPLLADGQASLNAQPSSSPPLPPLSPTELSAPELPPSVSQPRDGGQTKVMESFSLSVPSGWGVVFEDETSIILGMPDHNSIIWIMVEDNLGFKVQDLAEFYSIMLDGTWPKPNNELYVFMMEGDDQVEEMVVVVGPLDEDRHFVISFGGDAEASGVEYIIGSLKER
jgi:S1-C subfamily serine protease